MKFLILKILLIFSILSISFYGPYKSFLSYKNSFETKIIYIPNGLSKLSILNEIYKSNNFIEDLYIRLFLFFNNGNYQAGEYDLNDLSLLDIHTNLIKGNTVTHQISIIPGMNKFEIDKVINDSYLINDCVLLSCINNSLKFNEGVITPDTYFYKLNMNASNLLINSSDNFFKYSNNLWANKPDKNPLKSLEEALILASIIEKEAGNESEKPLIAAVFLKRISLGMKLQADPTIIYGLLPDFDGDIKKSDIYDKNNAYNTYVINSLPPSPIATSSKSSIKAAILSTPGDYLYFVANKKGSHYFSKTYKEHLEAVKLYQLQ